MARGNLVGGKTFTTDQITFMNLIIDHLAEHVVVEPTAQYVSPYPMSRRSKEIFDIGDICGLMPRVQGCMSALPA
jgi:hypothetical protein